jgi:hypothetical protein
MIAELPIQPADQGQGKTQAESRKDSTAPFDDEELDDVRGQALICLEQVDSHRSPEEVLCHH